MSKLKMRTAGNVIKNLNPRIAKIVTERIIKKQKGYGYHDDSTCGYTCHSDGN